MREGDINCHAGIRASREPLGGNLLDAASDAPVAAASLVEAQWTTEDLEVRVVGERELVVLDLAPALDTLLSGLPRTAERTTAVASCRIAWAITHVASCCGCGHFFC